MEVLYVIVPFAVVFAGFAVLWFIWSVRHGQYDDHEGAAERILLDDEPKN